MPVEEPLWNLELLWVVDDSHELLNLILGELTGTGETENNVSGLKRGVVKLVDVRKEWMSCSPLVRVYFCLLADKVGETLTDTSDLGDGEHDLTASVNVCVEHTKNVLEIGGHHEPRLERRRKSEWFGHLCERIAHPRAEKLQTPLRLHTPVIVFIHSQADPSEHCACCGLASKQSLAHPPTRIL